MHRTPIGRRARRCWAFHIDGYSARHHAGHSEPAAIAGPAKTNRETFPKRVDDRAKDSANAKWMARNRLALA